MLSRHGPAELRMRNTPPPGCVLSSRKPTNNTLWPSMTSLRGHICKTPSFHNGPSLFGQRNPPQTGHPAQASA